MKSAERSFVKKVTVTPCPNGHPRILTPGCDCRKGAILPDQVFIAFGSNLLDRAGRSSIDLCRWAIEALARHPDMTPIAVSHWYRTRPVPASDQPDYINGVAAFASALAPLVLLAALHTIETEAGRVRSVANAARVLDLDLLVVGDRVIQLPNLVVPHPRLHERAFVLRPLCDIAPEWRHPILGRSARVLLNTLPEQDVERLEP